MAIHVRWAIRRDLPAMLRIESRSYGCPWEEADFLDFLRQRHSIMHVAEDGATCAVVGYVGYEIKRSHYLLRTLAVVPEWRRYGLGSRLVNTVIGKVARSRKAALVAEVSERNLPAHLFLRAMGMQAVKVLRGHFADDSDGYRFVFRNPAAVATRGASL